MTTEKTMRVLIVDDESSVREVLSQVLTEDGFDVHEARSGADALRQFEKQPFPLVISDIVMPEMNGIELLQNLKEKDADTQVIIITSHASLQTAIQALRCGAYDYLFKPFEDLDLISAAARRAIERIQLIAENRKLVEKLKGHNEDLEKRVGKRTAELELLNSQLVMEIQERVRAQDAAEAATRAKSRFLANMSHELRSPLNHIIGFTEIVLSKHFGELNEVQEEYLADALKSSKQLLNSINKLLDFSTRETAPPTLSLKKIDVRHLLRSGVKVVQAEAAKRRINLALQLDGLNGRVRADENKLKQIIYNLLASAVKHASDGGRLDVDVRLLPECPTRAGKRWNDPADMKVILDAPVEASPAQPSQGQGLWVAVRDAGDVKPPVDRENSDRRGQGSNTGRRKGTDTEDPGLALTRSLVQSHGGKMWLESRPDGKQTVYNFLIPLS
jgi:signal transduction histidine kinase